MRIDHREPKELAELLSHPQIEVSIEYLELGDIIVNDTIIIERKQCTNQEGASDFKNSILDKRLFSQSERLKFQEEYFPVILLEGSCYDNSASMLVQSLDGAISFLAVIQSNISVLTTYNLRHTAYMIAKVGTHQRDGLGYDIPMRPKKPVALSDKKSFFLKGIDGIGKIGVEKILSVLG